MAIIFTIFQGIEYNVSSFTISDGAFGTCFFFGTGFHGSIIYVALFIFIYIIHKTEIAPLAPQASGATNFKISPLAPQASGATSSINNNELLITLPNTLTNKPKILPYSLRKEFIE
jgi:hypothetical protein